MAPNPTAMEKEFSKEMTARLVVEGLARTAYVLECPWEKRRSEATINIPWSSGGGSSAAAGGMQWALISSKFLETLRIFCAIGSGPKMLLPILRHD